MLQPLLDLLYPPKCGLCGKIGPRGLCDDCRAKFTPAPKNLPTLKPLLAIHAPFLYESGADQAIKRLKFDRITPLAAPLSQILAEYAKSIPHDVVIPVPISRARRAERGFNQAELLAKAFPPDVVRPEYLQRTKYTKPQVGLHASERLTNLIDAFACPQRLSNAKVLMIDDVITTGGTAIACANELLKNGASEVRVLAVAYQPANSP